MASKYETLLVIYAQANNLRVASRLLWSKIWPIWLDIWLLWLYQISLEYYKICDNKDNKSRSTGVHPPNGRKSLTPRAMASFGVDLAIKIKLNRKMKQIVLLWILWMLYTFNDGTTKYLFKQTHVKHLVIQYFLCFN